MLTVARVIFVLAALCHLARASAATARLMATARHPDRPRQESADAPESHTSNARDVLRAARNGADVDAVRDAVARHAASAHSSANQSDAEFEMLRHNVTQLRAVDWLRIGAALVALTTFGYATYQTAAAVRRHRGAGAKMSVPIDHKSVKRLWKSAPSVAN